MSYLALLNTSADIGLLPESSAMITLTIRMMKVRRDMTTTGKMITILTLELRLRLQLKE